MMPYKNQLDLHTHSDNSPDGRHSVTLMCEAALREGIRALAITDHCECNAYIHCSEDKPEDQRYDHYDRRARQSAFEVMKARAVFSGRLLVLCGVELGQPLQDENAARDVLSACPFDFVLMSLHNLAGRQDFYYLDYSLPENQPLILLKQYFDELLRMAEICDYDALAHMTYPLRYMTGIHGIAVNLRDFSEEIDAILKTLVRRGKALEINTSGLFPPAAEEEEEEASSLPNGGALGELFPSPWIIKRFRELGGEYVTVGSDAHNADDIGRGFVEAVQAAEEAGFANLTLYQRREPVLIKIEN